jgi:hypothetical protein
MRGKDDLVLLKQIVCIREVQLAVAETEATRSASQMNEKQTLRAAREQEREVLEEGWTRAVEMPLMRPDVTGGWASAVLRVEQEVHRANADVARAKAKHDRDAEAFVLAQNLSEAAQVVVRRVRRKQQRRRDEVALQDASDLFLQRWVRS